MAVMLNKFVLFSILLMLPLRGMSADLFLYSTVSGHQQELSVQEHYPHGTGHHEAMAGAMACDHAPDHSPSCWNEQPSKGKCSCFKFGDCCGSALLAAQENRPSPDTFRSPYRAILPDQPYPGFIPDGPERPPKLSRLG